MSDGIGSRVIGKVDRRLMQSRRSSKQWRLRDNPTNREKLAAEIGELQLLLTGAVNQDRLRIEALIARYKNAPAPLVDYTMKH